MLIKKKYDRNGCKQFMHAQYTQQYLFVTDSETIINSLKYNDYR